MSVLHSWGFALDKKETLPMPEFHIKGSITRFAINADGTELVIWYPEPAQYQEAYHEVFKQLQTLYAQELRVQNGKPPAPAPAPVTVMPLDQGGGVRSNEEAAQILHNPTLPLPPPPPEPLEGEAASESAGASVQEEVVGHPHVAIPPAHVVATHPPVQPQLVVPQVQPRRAAPMQPQVAGVPRAGDPSVVRGHGRAMATPIDEQGNIVGGPLTEAQVNERNDAAVQAQGRPQGQAPQGHPPGQGNVQRSAIRQPVRKASSSAGRRPPGPPPQIQHGAPRVHPQAQPRNPNHEPEEAWPPRNRFAKSHERMGLPKHNVRGPGPQGGSQQGGPPGAA